jgi:hypothetical protein
MNGIYFEQGRTAGEAATSWDDIKQCPHDQRTPYGKPRADVWKNGFTYSFRPPKAPKLVVVGGVVEAG